MIDGLTRVEQAAVHKQRVIELGERIKSGQHEGFNAKVAKIKEERCLNDHDTESLRTKLFKKIIRERMEEEFFAWCMFFLPKHFYQQLGAIHLEIADALFDIKHRNIALAAPRGTGKSTIVSLAYPLYNILSGKEHNIIIISTNDASAKKICVNIKDELMKNERITDFYGRKERKDIWSEQEFVWEDTITSAFGLGVPVRVSKFKQYRPSLAIIDDIETRDVFTLMANQEQWLRYKDYLYREVMPAMDPQIGKIRMIGTIFHPDAILPYMMKSSLFFSKTWSMIDVLPDGTEVSIFPTRFPLEDLYKLKGDLEAQGQAEVWWSEYMNRPISKGNKTFDSPIVRYTEEELARERTGLTYYIAFDLATGKGKDKTASVIIGRNNSTLGNAFVIDYFNERIEVDIAVDKIIDQVERFKPIRVITQSDLMSSTHEKAIRAKALMRGVNMPLELVKTHQMRQSTSTMGNSRVTKDKKETRMTFLIPWIKSGLLKCSEYHEDLIQQIENYPFTTNDDLIEAVREAVFHSYPSDGVPDSGDEIEELDLKLRELLDKMKDKRSQYEMAQSMVSGDKTDEFGRWTE